MSFLDLLYSYLKGLKNIFFPNYCINCNLYEPVTSLFLCVKCNEKLPYTNYDNDSNNPVVERLKLIQKIEGANALFYYSPQTLIQKIIQQIKYNGHIALAKELGDKMGKTFLHRPCFQDVDVLLPVPLAPKRLRKRGYNQAELLCLGVQKNYPNISINTTLLQRKYFTKSQTHIHNRYKRFLNVRDAFIINPAFIIKPFKHIIIIDDVITTGSTLSTCIDLINAIFPNTKISVLSLCVTIQE